MKIGILQETKRPSDLRVPLTPNDCKQLLDRYPNVQIFLQPCKNRCFTAVEYRQANVQIADDLTHCDLLLGVKEVNKNALIANKKYLFFSHTIKKQSQNRALLQAILDQNITLMDYEAITDDSGTRQVAFGHFAGIVGTHNAFVAWGKRTKQYNLMPAHACFDYAEMKKYYHDMVLFPLKIAVTGSGRVAAGAIELLKIVGIEQVLPTDFLTKSYTKPVFCQLKSQHLYQHKSNEKPFDRTDFHQHPSHYDSLFLPYAKVADWLINCIYWSPEAPRLFEKKDMKQTDFNIRLIADISCDINGSVPATMRSTTIHEPVMGYDALGECESLPYQKHTIDIMAVDNLPCELPRDASTEFSRQLAQHFMPKLIDIDATQNDVVRRATIAKDGKLTKDFNYLDDYVNELETT